MPLKSRARKCLALLALSVGILGPIPRAAAQAAPDQPTAYEAILWVDGGFPLTQASIARLRALGITAINAEGPEGVGRARGSGLPFYVDHAVPKGFLHVREKTFEEARARWRSDPTPENLRRGPCLRDPTALEAALGDLRKTLEVLGPAAPLFLSMTDEPSATRGVNPIDWCRDEACAADFPRFLTERWGSKAIAREIWGPRWPADGPPRPADTEDARRALFHGIGPMATVAQWNDTRAFADAALLEALGRLAAEARKLRPGIRIGLLGAQMPSAFGGFDWEEIGGRFDAIEPYDWGAARDLARSTSPRADLYQTIVAGDAPPAAIAHEIWRGFLDGDRGVILFDASAWTGTASRPAGAAPLEGIAPILAKLQSPALLPWRRATPLRAQVAVLHGMASTRVHWLLDTRFDGASWVNRLTSYETLESSEAVNREAWAALLSDLGLSYRFITPRQLRDGTLAEDGSLALVLPRAIAMADGDVAAIKEFGTRRLVIADCQLALLNARLQLREKPALDEMFGVARPKAATVDDFVTRDAEPRPGAPVVPAEAQLKAAGASAMHVVGTTPVFLVHGPGAARTAYLNARIGSYVKNRLTNPGAAERLRALLRPLLLAGGVRPRFEIAQLSGPPHAPFSVVARKDGEDLLVGVLLSATTGARPIDWNGRIASARARVRVTFPGTYQTSDLLTGDELGSRNSCEVEVSASQPAILRLHP
jgi:hypothetical protein